MINRILGNNAILGFISDGNYLIGGIGIVYLLMQVKFEEAKSYTYMQSLITIGLSHVQAVIDPEKSVFFDDQGNVPDDIDEIESEILQRTSAERDVAEMMASMKDNSQGVLKKKRASDQNSDESLSSKEIGQKGVSFGLAALNREYEEKSRIHGEEEQERDRKESETSEKDESIEGWKRNDSSQSDTQRNDSMVLKILNKNKP